LFVIVRAQQALDFDALEDLHTPAAHQPTCWSSVNPSFVTVEAAPGQTPVFLTLYIRWRLTVDRIDPPDLPRGARLSAARVNLIRPSAAAKRGGKAEKADASERARRLKSHGAISNAICPRRKSKTDGRFYRKQQDEKKAGRSIQARLPA
jgi:hypothetical protein